MFINFVPSCSLVSNYQETVFVNKIIDGDTFSSNNKTFRILGIDTPETFDWETKKLTNGKQYFYGKIAEYEISKLIFNKKVTIETEKKDKYNRWISKVIDYKKNDIALHLISNGFAIVRYISTNQSSPFYYYDTNYVNYLYQLEKEAKSNKKGFWSESIEDIKKIFPK